MADWITTTTLIDGQYQAQRVDINTVLLQNKRPSTVPPLPEHEPVELGLLTQTIVQSPVVNWTLSARLGNAQDHDVVFIGDNHLCFKRLDRSGSLNVVGDYPGLSYRIRNACVLGNIDYEPPRFVPEDGNEGGHKADQDDTSMPLDLSDSSCNSPLSDRAEVGSYGDSDANRSKGGVHAADQYGCKPYPLGPQFIVIVLESGTIVFLHALDKGPGCKIEPFITIERGAFAKSATEFGSTSSDDNYGCAWSEDEEKDNSAIHASHESAVNDISGTHLTRDPSSRFLAVGMRESFFTVYKVRAKDDIFSDYHFGMLKTSITEQMTVAVKGVIMNMEFLYPKQGDEDHIILLVVVCRKGALRMHVYEWDASQTLIHIRSNTKRGFTLDVGVIPLLLIPMTFRSAFLIVCERDIYVCEGLLQGEPVLSRSSTITNDEPTDAHNGNNPPLWTAWARPLRNEISRQGQDHIYLAREDGLIKLLESDQDELLAAANNVDGIKQNIGTAFAFLHTAFTVPGPSRSIGYTYHADALVIGGESGPGGVYWVLAGKKPKLTSLLNTWAPFNDFIIDNASDENQVRHSHAGTVMGCTGRGNGGTVFTLGRGVGAEIKLQFTRLVSDIRNMWALPIHSAAAASQTTSTPDALLVSFIHKSALFEVERDDEGATALRQTVSAWLDLNCCTVAAGYSVGFIIQVSENSISAGSASTLLGNDASASLPCVRKLGSDGPVTAAAIHSTELIIVSLTNGDGARELHLYALQSSEAAICLIAKLDDIPIYPNFISVEVLSENSFQCTIGYDGQAIEEPESTATKPLPSGLAFCTIDLEGRVISSLEIPTAHYEEDTPFHQPRKGSILVSSRSCVSAFTTDSDHGSITVAGYSDGILRLYHHHGSSRSLTNRPSREWKLGDTDIILSRLEGHPQTCFVCCDGSIYKLRVYASAWSSISIDRLWVKSELKVLEPQPNIQLCIPFADSLLVGSKASIQVLELEKDVTTMFVPVQTSHNAVPTRILQSSDGLLLTAVNKNGLGPAINIQYPGRKETVILNISNKTSLKQKERILAMTEWQGCPCATPSHRHILVGTSAGQLLSVIGSKLDHCSAGGSPLPENWNIILELRFEQPVYSVAADSNEPDSPFDVVCGVGDDSLCVLRARVSEADGLDLRTAGLYQIGGQRLPSYAASIIRDGRFVNVLTAKDSLLLFVWRGPGPGPRHLARLELVHQDRYGRDGLAQKRIALPPDTSDTLRSFLQIVSDKDCSVVGLQYRDKTALQEMITPKEYDVSFEAELPKSISKFVLGPLREQWTMSRLAERTPVGVIPWSDLAPTHRLLGISINGSVTDFMLLSKPAVRLLNALQYLAIRVLHSNPHHINVLRVLGLRHMESKESRNHIRGDLLHIWTDPNSLVAYMDNRPHTRSWSAEQRDRELILALEGLWSEHIKFEVTDGEMKLVDKSWEDISTHIATYLRYLLHLL